MNELIIIGNLTRDPEIRTTQNGIQVCSFTVAVNRRGNDQEADYFRVSAWRGLAEICQKYLKKGRKVYVEGTVRAQANESVEGGARASLEVTAREVEFLTPRGTGDDAPAGADETYESTGFVRVDDEDLPFK